MYKRLIAILADALTEYYSNDDLLSLCESFGVEPEENRLGKVNKMRLASSLLEELETGNHRSLLETLVPSLETRSSRGIAQNNWEAREHHEDMSRKIGKLT